MTGLRSKADHAYALKRYGAQACPHNQGMCRLSRPPAADSSRGRLRSMRRTSGHGLPNTVNGLSVPQGRRRAGLVRLATTRFMHYHKRFAARMSSPGIGFAPE